MLVGQKPFENENAAKLGSKILKGEFNKTDELWADISPKAQDLISQLIQVDASKRLSATEALAHSWFTKKQSSHASH